MNTMYINKRYYSDVASWMVYDIDEVNGTAMAIEVEKVCDHKSYVGGFCAHFPNLDEEFENCEPTIRKGAKAFKIKRNRYGNWGRNVEDIVCCWRRDDLTAEGWEKQKARTDVIHTFDSKGNECIKVPRLTKGGKVGTRFEALGNKLEPVCKYFRDFNF